MTINRPMPFPSTCHSTSKAPATEAGMAIRAEANKAGAA